MKATGVLNVEWERFKKQIAFRRGEPVASRSNWPHETLSQFLIRRKVLDAARLQAEMAEQTKAQPPIPFGEWLVQRGLIAAHDFNELLDAHFRERVFNLIPLTHGEVSFEAVEDLKLKETDQAKFHEPFLKMLWDAAKLHIDEANSKARLATLGAKPFKAKGDFPLSLAPKDLRLWNDLQKTLKTLNAWDAESLRLAAVALEFQQLEVGANPEEKLLQDFQALEKKFKGANPFEILGVEVQADTGTCRKAYLDLVKRYHPDRLPPESSPKLKALAEALFAKINEAHSTATDAEKRAEYEAKIELERQGGMEQIEKTLEAEMLIPQAKMALNRRHFKAAHEIYLKIIEVLPKDGELLADFAYCKVMQLIEGKIPYKSKVPEFVKDIERALKLRSNYAQAYYYRGMILKLEGQTDKALQDFDQALSLDSSLTEAASESRLLRTRKDSSGKGGGFFGKKS